MVLLLSQRDLRPLLDDLSQLEGVFRGIESSVTQHQAGEAGFGALVGLPLGGEGRSVTLYATAPTDGLTVRVFPSVGSPTPDADGHVMLLFDGEVGRLEAMLAGDDLNPLRTSVPAGVGAKYLAPTGARVLCILGSGLQAHSHARTFHHALPSIEEIRVWSPTPANRQRFADETAEVLGLPVTAVDTGQEAVEGADVITATGSVYGPALEASWVRPGALMVSMTNCAPPELRDGGRFVVPSLTRPVPLALAPIGRGGGPPAGGGRGVGGTQPTIGGAPVPPGTVELAAIMAGSEPAREHADQTVVFELANMYAWDAAIMRWAYDWAVASGAGTRFPLTTT